MPAIIEVKYFNTFLLKKIPRSATGVTENYGESPDGRYPVFPGTPEWDIDGLSWNNSAISPVDDITLKYSWFIEESRIRGGYNNASVDFGVRAYTTEDEINQQRFNSIIYSGVYNSRTGVNETNVFSIGESIVKSLDPTNGSIQKLYAEDTNLIIFQENKVSRALIDKDAIYSAEGGGAVTSTNLVVGQVIPYAGQYGISRNPESFAKFGFRKYFADRNRGVVLRLSKDGMTEISNYGMSDYFRDNLALISEDWKLQKQYFELDATSINPGGQNVITVNLIDDNWPVLGAQLVILDANSVVVIKNNTYITNVQHVSGSEFNLTLSQSILLSTPGDFRGSYLSYYTKSKAVGGYDIHNQQYVLSLQSTPNYSADENYKDTSKYATVAFDDSINGWTSFYTYKPTFIDSLKGNFYSFIGNNIYKHYNLEPNTRNTFYNLYNDSSVSFVFNPNPSVVKNFQTIAYEGNSGWEVSEFASGFEGVSVNIDPTSLDVWVQHRDTTAQILSFEEGKYVANNIQYNSGFARKENLYVANLVNDSAPRYGEVVFGPDGFGGYPTTGIKGFFATVTMSTDQTTQVGGLKELFAASSKFVKS